MPIRRIPRCLGLFLALPLCPTVTALSQNKSAPPSLPLPDCQKQTTIPYGTLTGVGLWTYLMNRQVRAVCQEPFYIGAHRGAHTQDASFAPLIFGNPTRTSFVVADPPGNNIRWDNFAALDQYDTGRSYPFIVNENTSLGFQQLVTLAGRGVLDPAVNIIEMDPRETADSPFQLVLNHDPFYNRMLAPGGTTSLPPASGWPPPVRVSSKRLC